MQYRIGVYLLQMWLRNTRYYQKQSSEYTKKEDGQNFSLELTLQDQHLAIEAVTSLDGFWNKSKNVFQINDEGETDEYTKNICIS